MPDEILADLNLEKTDVSSLPGPARTSLVAYLLRWEYYSAAELCLLQLLDNHSHLVSVYDNLARLYLATDRSDRALEMMNRRHAIRTSNTSRALEARIHLAAGDLASAQAILDHFRSEQPGLILTWNLQAELSLASGDLEAAEAAWDQREALRPGAAATALGLARVWQARGDIEKALLWARTALARADRNQRGPSKPLLSFLEQIYSAAGQDAQAESVRARLRQRKQDELDVLRERLSSVPPAEADRPREPQAGPAADEPSRAPLAVLAETADAPSLPVPVTGAVELSSA